MKTLIENDEVFDCSIETSEWRYNAAIVGLIKYFDYLHRKGKVDREDAYEIDEDILRYNSKLINEEDYLLFVEDFFSNAMHHIIIESILSGEEITEEQLVLVNEKLKANSVMKSVFGKLSCTIENKEEILNLVNENRLKIIKETYRNGKSLYSNFSNSSLLLSTDNKVCRLLGYYIDTARKSKSISYKQNYSTFEFKDDLVFDFIPFAFTKSYEAFFINNNTSIKNLIKSNSLIELSENPRETLFNSLKESTDYIDFDVEVITKDRGEDYYKTLYIRKKALDIFKAVKNYKGIQFAYRDDVKNPRYMERPIVDSILNGIKLDPIIEMLLKSKNNYSYNIKTIIEINILIYGGSKEMNNKMKSAFISAKQVAEKLEKNKLNSYRQKLISAITFKDSSKVCETLIQLSAYSGVQFTFVYDLFENYDESKNLIYTFANALVKEEKKQGGNENEK